MLAEKTTMLIGSLITTRESIPPDMAARKVSDIFFHSPQIEALAVVDGNEPIGLVTRAKLFQKLFRRYGFELYGNKSIMTITDTDPLIIHASEQLDVAMDKALERSDTDIYDEIIVVDDTGCFKGCLSVKQMIIQQSNTLANSIIQKEMARERARELEKVNEVKSQFIANVTHELRSPVNAIIGIAELMKMSTDKGHLNQLRDRLSLLMSSAVNLRAIITNILDLSKIEAGKMEVFFDRFDLVALLAELAETAQILAGGKDIEIKVTSGYSLLEIESDMVKVRQIMMNLLSNAVKFTEKGVIVIDLAGDGVTTRLSVRDSGIGISRENIERIFEAFSQVENVHTKRYEGTGLGLTITKNLVQILGGTITIASAEGEGTTFTVSLPNKTINKNP
jgi:signal transduction histidine kinase